MAWGNTGCTGRRGRTKYQAFYDEAESKNFLVYPVINSPLDLRYTHADGARTSRMDYARRAITIGTGLNQTSPCLNWSDFDENWHRIRPDVTFRGNRGGGKRELCPVERPDWRPTPKPRTEKSLPKPEGWRPVTKPRPKHTLKQRPRGRNPVGFVWSETQGWVGQTTGRPLKFVVHN